MSFFSKYGNPVKSSTSKSASARDSLLEGLKKQKQLLDGKAILNPKGKPIKSWFKDGQFKPTVGLNLLFDGFITYKDGQEQEIISDLEKAVHDGEMDTFLEAIDKKKKDSKSKK